MIRSGQYFTEARAWYAAMYIGPIAERSFFLIIAALATMIALVGFLAVSGLMPITERPGIIIRSDRIDEVVPHLSRVKPVGTPIEPAMETAFLELYVNKREGYEVSHYVSNYAFVVAHSDQPTGAAYAQMYAGTNPQSPAAILGYNGQRIVQVDSIQINDKVEPRTATIAFHTDLINVAANSATTRWTAQLQYYYTPTIVTPGKDATGNATITTQDPQFQVVNYVLTKAP